MSDNETSSAFLSRIAEVALAEFDDDGLYIAKPSHSLVLGAAHLESLQMQEEDRLDSPESVARLVEISRLVDVIQDGSETLAAPTEAPGFVSDIFKQIVDNVEFIAAPLSAVEQSRYERALGVLYAEPSADKFQKTEAYELFASLRVDEARRRIKRLELLRERASSKDEATLASLDAEISIVEELLQSDRDMISAIDALHGLIAAEQVVRDAERTIDELPNSVKSALDIMDSSRVTDAISNTAHIACEFFPSSLTEGSWTSVHLTAQDLTGSDNSGSPAKLNGAAIESIDVETQVLTVDRPWLWAALFENPRWDWRTQWCPISTGVGADIDKVLMPAYIYALVFARKLVVKGKQVVTEQSNAKISGQVLHTNWINQALAPASVRMENVQLKVLGTAVPVEAPDDARRLNRMRLMASRPGMPALTLNATPSLTTLRANMATAKLASSRPEIARVNVEPARLAAMPAALARTRSTAAVVGSATIPTPQNIRSVGTVSQPHSTTALKAKKFAVRAGKKLTSGPRMNMAAMRGIAANLRYAAKGSLRDELDRPIFGARIVLVERRESQTFTSDRNGDFTITGVSQGRHRISINREGFKPAIGTLKVPQSEKPVIRMNRIGDSKISVTLTEKRGSDRRPFVGPAQLLVTTSEGRRIETLNGQSSIQLAVPHGPVSLSLTVRDARTVTPSQVDLNLRPGENNTVEISIVAENVLKNDELQLLAVICRRVPASPAA